jgi:hypothetical protein
MHCKSQIRLVLVATQQHPHVSFSLQTAVIEVNRTSPVVIVRQHWRSIACASNRCAHGHACDYHELRFRLRDSLAVLDVDAGKLAFLDQFPFNALPFSYDATAAATKAILDAAEQFVNLPVASYHGALTLSTLSISRAPTSAACKACGPLQRIDGRTGDVPACVCEFGYARAADTCSPLTRTISAKTTTSVSNAAPVEVRLTSTESLGYGGAMRCVFGTT